MSTTAVSSAAVQKQLKQGKVKKGIFSVIRHLVLALLAFIWLVPITWLFRLTQEYYNYKMAAALGIMVFIVCAVFTVVCFHFINKKEATFS